MLLQLTPKCRAAVALRYRHELSYEEIGERLGVSSNMVKKYLVQEVYVRMLRVNDIDAIRNPEAYLYTVASNLVKEHAVLERRQADGIGADDASIQDLLGELPTVERDLDTGRRVRRLRSVLLQLTPKCRAAVALRYRHELSYEEIGERLGVSSNMVKKYLVQALARCRCRMSGME